MHEAAIAMALIDQALQSADEHGATRITEVEVELGILQQVVPEALQTAFDAAVLGTAAEGAELVLVEQQAEAVCRQCATRFQPSLEAFSFCCPNCMQADVEIVAGNHVTLTSLTCE